MSEVKLFNLSNYVRPEIKEKAGQKWVLNGSKNSFYQYIIDRYNGSPTNRAVINAYNNLLYGRGVVLSGQNELYEDLYEIFPKREIRKCLNDFKTFGMYSMQIIRAVGGGVASIQHIPVDKLAMEKMDEDGEINGVFYCDDWAKHYSMTPEYIPMFKGQLTAPLMVKVVAPYCVGNAYYSNPDYLASLQYAEIEEEISNFSINHILNGLSFGYIINMNNGGSLTPEEKDEIQRQIKEQLAGSQNAGKFIVSFNDGKEAEVTIQRLEVNDAHNQWESLRDDAKQQILTSHGVVSPLLFGLPSAGGFGSNAEEMDTSTKILNDFQIKPKQEIFIDELGAILELNGLETDLQFLDLRETYNSTEETIEPEIEDNVVDEETIETELSNVNSIDDLIGLGEDVDEEEWELVDEVRCDEITFKEEDLNTIFNFARAPRSNKGWKSKQDTSLFKVRYKYAGKTTGDRDFCKKVISANKYYRAEDLNKELSINAQFAPSGKNKYNIFKFKGGVNCKHFWQRVVFLKKGNKQISVNEARRMILQLDPSERKDAKWEQNDKRVAQIAQPSNNWWSLKPNYRK